MKRLSLTVWIAILALLFAVAVAYAYNQAPIHDVFSDTYGAAQNTTRLNVQSSFSGSGCSPQLTTYMRWDLSSIDDGRNVGTASLAMTVHSVTLGSGQANLRLYRVANDTWSETDTTVQPLLGDSLGTIALNASNPPNVGDTLTFPNTPELRQFITDQINGDNFASFALQLTECTIGAPVIRFHSAEPGSGGTPPSLELLGPNAVTLRTFGSNNPALNPLILGGVALLLAGVAGIVVARRRRLAN